MGQLHIPRIWEWNFQNWRLSILSSQAFELGTLSLGACVWHLSPGIGWMPIGSSALDHYLLIARLFALDLYREIASRGKPPCDYNLKVFSLESSALELQLGNVRIQLVNGWLNWMAWLCTMEPWEHQPARFWVRSNWCADVLVFSPCSLWESPM